MLCVPEKALHDNSEIDYLTESYLLSIRFMFKPREKTIEKPVVCNSVGSWFQTCKKYDSDDVKGIYYAVMTADQFGGMSSWNDCPSCEAETRGLGKLYDELSDKLLEQIRYNMMYIVNESWI